MPTPLSSALLISVLVNVYFTTTQYLDIYPFIHFLFLSPTIT